MSTSILQACFERLQTLGYSPAPEVLWPGKNQKPPQGKVAWLEAGYFPNEPVDRTWQADSSAEQRGFLQVLVGYRPGMGEIGPSELADAVVAHFPKGTSLAGVVVTKQPTRSPAFVDDGDKLFIPVTIPYRGFICAESSTYMLTIGSTLFQGVQSYGYGNGLLTPTFGSLSPNTLGGGEIGGIAIAYNPGSESSAFQGAIENTVDLTGKLVRLEILGESFLLNPSFPISNFTLITTSTNVPLWIREYLIEKQGEAVPIDLRIVDE